MPESFWRVTHDFEECVAFFVALGIGLYYARAAVVEGFGEEVRDTQAKRLTDSFCGATRVTVQ